MWMPSTLKCNCACVMKMNVMMIYCTLTPVCMHADNVWVKIWRTSALSLFTSCCSFVISIDQSIVTSLPPVIVSTSLSDPSDDRLLVVGELAIEYLHFAVLYKPYLIAYTGDEELIMTDNQDATVEGFECIG